MTMTVDQVSADVERLTRKLMTEDTDRPISPDDTFVELGLDSLKLVDLLGAAEVHFDMEVPDEEVGSFVRVRDLTDFVLRAR
ncbi:acyl carrier protein [Micromonospora echinofusca]|uniref:Acyl carrier protein n=1 Tax=Micromonospora echinofusca TaxID=47858 RepID=A0ABS3VLF4_MICEH|nr:phosphopantetheine-binding protein [Micromonospora echinofusca]MBO4205375.1 acyl carrier protein [Micromonospora echinofusca]